LHRVGAFVLFSGFGLAINIDSTQGYFMTSQINPNNIDGNFPVAGVPNNTQGFRDNFTNTSTNFQYASDEITELQNKGVFKAALTGTTLDNNMNDGLIYAVKLGDISYTYTALTATSGTVTVDYAAAQFQQINPTGNISLAFTNWPISGTAGTVRVGINVTNTAYTVTIPAAVSQGLVHLQGCSPGTAGVSNTITFTEVGNYAFEFVTVDGGTTIWIFDNSRPTDYFSSNVNIAATTVSTSTTTGALTVGGGVGIGGNVYAGGRGVFTGNVSAANIAGTGSILTTGSTGGIGYATGAGGTVSQSGNKSGAVTLNTVTGEITMQNTALAAATTVNFVLTNSAITNKDLLLINQTSTANSGGYVFNAICGTGNANIAVRNVMAASASDAVVLRYAVIRGSIT
jgi:hypothetical protein